MHPSETKNPYYVVEIMTYAVGNFKENYFFTCMNESRELALFEVVTKFVEWYSEQKSRKQN